MISGVFSSGVPEPVRNGRHRSETTDAGFPHDPGGGTMNLTSTLILYCVLILLASLLGGWVPLWIRLTHRRMEIAVSFVAGIMLGVAFFHMIPHAQQALGSIDRLVWWMLMGMMVMFLVERFFCFHHHPAAVDDPVGGTETSGSHPHGHAHGGEPGSVDPEDPACEADESFDRHSLSWSGVLVGMTVHTLLAGVALAASAQAEFALGTGTSLVGFGTFLVIFLHKPLDSMTIGTVMAAARQPVRLRHVVNMAFALVIPVGVAIFHGGLRLDTGSGQAFVGCALAFSAGTFFCIALSDLLPELHFHRHDRVILTAALLFGLGVAYVIALFAHQGHHHDRETRSPAGVHQHDHGSGPDHDPRSGDSHPPAGGSPRDAHDHEH
jgi:zinc and cadmium transporter